MNAGNKINNRCFILFSWKVHVGVSRWCRSGHTWPEPFRNVGNLSSSTQSQVQGSLYTTGNVWMRSSQRASLNVKVRFPAFRTISSPFPNISPRMLQLPHGPFLPEPGSLFHHTDFQLLERVLQIKQQAPDAHMTQRAVEQICFPFPAGVSRTSFF